VSPTEILAYLVAAAIAVPISRRLGFGSVLGYLAAGVAIGPWALGLVDDVDHVLHVAEAGVILLLFVIGLELQPSRLWALRRAVFGTGAAQVLVSGAALWGVALAFGLPPGPAAIVGLTLALSSTAFVLQLLAERKQLTTRHGRAAFSILLFQDLAVIPLLALVPMLSPGGGEEAGPGLAEIVLQVGAVAGLILGGRWLLRPVFRLVARDGGHEIFTAAALLIVIATATLMASVGLSAALGAFIAGVLLADSEFRHQLEAEIEPFKGLFLGLFFVAVGMSANLGLLAEIPLRIVGMTVILLGVKGVVLAVLGRLTGLPGGSSRSLAMVLSQGGEFAFVLLGAATQGRLIELELFQTLVLVVTLSMVATPFLVLLDEWLCRRAQTVEEPRPFETPESDDHRVVVAGLGRFGQIVARVLNMRGIPFTALESDARHVDFLRRFGNVVYYGDARRLDLLRAAHADKAKIFVVAVEDIEASTQIVEIVKRHFPQLKVFARATDRAHARALMDRKVDYVIRASFASSLEMAENVLMDLGDDRDRAHDSIRRFREFDEQLLERERALAQDEGKLIQTVRDAERELAFLFASDDHQGRTENKAGDQ
jgi:glutathione-regulated potassium-efflux system ancillary protein KefC/glutathione-regulated potassium-efflux system protein KefB